MEDQFFRDTAETGREDTIQAGTFGGLNTTANALNLPWTDSPEMTNVDVTVGGNVVKRNGTRLLVDFTPASPIQVSSIDQFQLGSGLVFVALKVGTTLSVQQVINDALIQTTGFTNVWSAVAANQKASVVATNEAEPRMLFLTPGNAPIQLHAVELSERVTTGAGSYAIADTGLRFANSIEDTTLFCYKNGVQQVNTTFNYTAGVLTYTAAVVPGDVITFVNFTWQWWAESELYDVNRFYDVVTRFSIDDSDRLVTIPERLRDGVELDSFGLYRLYVAQGGQGNRDASYYIRNVRPVNDAQYATTNGTLNNAALTWDFPPVGSTHLSFGTFVPATAANSLHLLRIRKLNMNGGRKIDPDNLKVQGYDFDSTYTITQAGATATTDFASYLLFDGDAWIDPDAVAGMAAQLATPALRFPTPLAVSGAAGNYVTLDRGAKRGAPLNDIVRFTNVELKWVGSGANSNIDKYRLGAAVPAYGFGRYADYGQGIFPRTGAIYNGRMVLGGMAADPMRLLFSSITDTEFPGETFQGFTIDAFQDPNTSAFDIELAGSASEGIEAIQGYQGSVFIGTNENVYRVFSRQPLNAQTALTQLTGKAGALNTNAFAVGDAGLYFLGRQGVYMAVPSDGLDDSYNLQDISLKIRDRLRQPETVCSRLYSNIQYDPERRKVYVSVYTSENTDCNANFTDLYVLHTERGAWTKYETFENLRIADMTQYRDTNGARRFMIATLSPDGASTRFLRTEWDWPTDYTRIVSNSFTGPLLSAYVQTFSTIAGVQRYPHKVWTSGFDDVEDMVVTLDGVPLAFGDRWAKAGRNAIYLRETPASAFPVTITTRSPEGEDTVAVRRYGAFIAPGAGYTRAGNTITFDSNTATYTYGRSFISVFRTPVFTWGLLADYKRAIKWSGLFSNAPSNEKFADDLAAPAADRAALIGRAKVLSDVNIAIIYNNEREGTSSYDVFRLGELIYDISLFDTYDGPYTLDEYVQIVEPLQGTGYSVQVALWSYDRNTYEFAGYQLIAQKKGKRFAGDNR